MACTVRRRCVVLLLAGALVATARPAATAGEGWTVLFGGRSTDAWRGYGRESFPAECWTVEGGALATVAGAKASCDIITRDKYRDFELELEYKLGPGGNSGVLYRVAELTPPEPSWHSGPELQILDDDRYRQNSPKTWTGALYDMIAAKDATVRPVGSGTPSASSCAATTSSTGSTGRRSWSTSWAATP